MWPANPLEEKRYFKRIRSVRSNDRCFLKFPSRCHHCATIFQQQSRENLMRRDGISKTMVWKKCVSPGELRTCGNVPPFGMPVPSAKRAEAGLLFIHNDKRRRLDAHCAGCSADGGCSPPTLWRHRTGGTLADRRTGSAGKRRHFVRQRGFPDLGKLDAT